MGRSAGASLDLEDLGGIVIDVERDLKRASEEIYRDFLGFEGVSCPGFANQVVQISERTKIYGVVLPFIADS